MRTSAILCAYNLGFIEICGVSARTRGKGVDPVLTFCRQGEEEGLFFAIMFGRLLWMALNSKELTEFWISQFEKYHVLYFNHIF